VTRKSLRNATRGHQSKIFQDSLSHAVTRPVFVTRRPLVVLGGPESNAEPGSNLLGVPPPVGPHPVLFPAEFSQPLVEDPFRERVFVTGRLGPGRIGRVQIRYGHPALLLFPRVGIGGGREDASVLQEFLEPVGLLAVLFGGRRNIRRIAKTFAVIAARV